jgi:hypothetical protein
MLGPVVWQRCLVWEGWRTSQASSAYVLALSGARTLPPIPANAPADRESVKPFKSVAPCASIAAGGHRRPCCAGPATGGDSSNVAQQGKRFRGPRHLTGRINHFPIRSPKKLHHTR